MTKNNFIDIIYFLIITQETLNHDRVNTHFLYAPKEMLYQTVLNVDKFISLF